MFPSSRNCAGESGSNSSSSIIRTAVRKPVTRIENPYAKKRPRPNPAAPITGNAPVSQPVPRIHQHPLQHPAASSFAQNRPLKQNRPATAAGRRSPTTAQSIPVKYPSTVVGQQQPYYSGTNTTIRQYSQTAANAAHRPPIVAQRNYNNSDSARASTYSKTNADGSNTYAYASSALNRAVDEGERSRDNNSPLSTMVFSGESMTEAMPAPGNSKRDSFDSLGDSSIDWEEAVRVIDNAHNSSAPVATSQAQQHSQQQACTGTAFPTTSRPTNHVEPTFTSSPVANRQSQPETRNAHEALRAASLSSSLNSQNHSATNNISVSVMMKKPPTVPTAQRSTMASLRPSIWSKTKTGTNKPSNNGAPGGQSSPQLSQQFLSQEGKFVSSPAQHPLISKLPRELQFSPDSIQPVKDDYKTMLVRHANVSKPLANGWTLFDHQKKAILKALAMRRFILALDMGLGKTLIGCVWARAFQKTFENCKIIVICPVSLKQEWTRTAREATELRVEDDEKAKPKKKKLAKTKKGAKVKKGIEEEAPIETDENDSTSKVQICSWAKVPTSVENSVDNYVVVCDEAHSLQSMQAARTKDLLMLVKPKRCVGVLLLTGTPMKNGKPSNLFPLLRAVGHPFGFNQRAYETQFCGGRTVQFGRGPAVWDAGGSSNLPQLRELVSSHLLHLTKDECLKSLPPRTRRFQHIPVSHRMQLQHTQALQDIAKLFTMSSKMDSDNSKALLGAAERLRLVSALAKVDAGVNIAKGILEKEPAIVIFTSFVSVAKALHQKLASAGWPGELLTGEVPGHKRQDMVDNFQNGNSAVFVCTFGAGGVGLTLTAARSIILLDRPWTPGDAHQAEDRIRRIGQMHPVTSIWVTAFDVDKQIDAVLESKTNTANAVLDKGYKKAHSNGTKSQKISIFQLIKQILPGATRGSSTGSCMQEGGGRCLSQTSIDSYYVN